MLLRAKGRGALRALGSKGKGIRAHQPGYVPCEWPSGARSSHDCSERFAYDQTALEIENSETGDKGKSRSNGGGEGADLQVAADKDGEKEESDSKSVGSDDNRVCDGRLGKACAKGCSEVDEGQSEAGLGATATALVWPSTSRITIASHGTTFPAETTAEMALGSCRSPNATALASPLERGGVEKIGTVPPKTLENPVTVASTREKQEHCEKTAISETGAHSGPERPSSSASSRQDHGRTTADHEHVGNESSVVTAELSSPGACTGNKSPSPALLADTARSAGVARATPTIYFVPQGNEPGFEGKGPLHGRRALNRRKNDGSEWATGKDAQPVSARRSECNLFLITKYQFHRSRLCKMYPGPRN